MGTEQFEDLNPYLVYTDKKNTKYEKGMSNIPDGSVTSTKIASGAVTSDKIASGAVTSDKIASGAVTAGKIASGAVTADEIASGAVTAGKIASGGVTKEKIYADAVAKEKARSYTIPFDEESGTYYLDMDWESYKSNLNYIKECVCIDIEFDKKTYKAVNWEFPSTDNQLYYIFKKGSSTLAIILFDVDSHNEDVTAYQYVI